MQHSIIPSHESSILQLRSIGVSSKTVCYCRARKLRATLKLQSQAVTVIAARVRTFLQKKRYMDLKKRHYAAIRIQAAFRYHYM